LAIQVTDIYEYPLKSSRGNRLASAEIGFAGLINDRKVAVINSNNKIVTGREYPELLRVGSEINKNFLHLKSPGQENIAIDLNLNRTHIIAKLFGQQVGGAVLESGGSQWISKVLNGDFRLIAIFNDSDTLSGKALKTREFSAKYVDSAPVHLINLKTLAYLNSKLKDKVGPQNFRPNIVVEADEPFEEDYWTEININGCFLKLHKPTERCIFTTIDLKLPLKIQM